MKVVKESALAGIVALAAMTALAAAAGATVMVDVEAQANSSSGSGTPLDTGVDLTAGDTLVVTTDYLDMWRAGSGNRESNADGLGNPFGGDFGNHTQDGLSTLYGTLVGMIGTGDFFPVGTSFNDTVGDTGRLKFVYWDSNSFDNSGSVRASIDVNPASSVPEPATLGFLGLGLVGLGLFRRRTAV